MGHIRITGVLSKDARRSIEAGGKAAWLTLTLSVDGQRNDIVAEWRYGSDELAVNVTSVRAARTYRKGTPVSVTARDYRIHPRKRCLQLLEVTDVTRLNVPALHEPQEKETA